MSAHIEVPNRICSGAVNYKYTVHRLLENRGCNYYLEPNSFTAKDVCSSYLRPMAIREWHDGNFVPLLQINTFIKQILVCIFIVTD